MICWNKNMRNIVKQLENPNSLHKTYCSLIQSKQSIFSQKRLFDFFKHRESSYRFVLSHCYFFSNNDVWYLRFYEPIKCFFLSSKFFIVTRLNRFITLEFFLLKQKLTGLIINILYWRNRRSDVKWKVIESFINSFIP